MEILLLVALSNSRGGYRNNLTGLAIVHHGNTMGSVGVVSGAALQLLYI